MVGFNRRFSPLIQKLIKSKIFGNTAIEINYRVNFGRYIENNLTNVKIGGGRLIGSCCHYVDLMAYLANSDIYEVSAFGLIQNNKISDNTFSCILKFINGSIGHLSFTSSGNRSFTPKETISISGNENVVNIIDFKKMSINEKTFRVFRHSYGALYAWKEFYKSVNNKTNTKISISDGLKATIVTLGIKKSLENNGALQKIIY